MAQPKQSDPLTLSVVVTRHPDTNMIALHIDGDLFVASAEDMMGIAVKLGEEARRRATEAGTDTVVLDFPLWHRSMTKTFTKETLQ